MPNIDKAVKGIIRSLDRGLRVLRAIGQQGADPASLARQTGIDRATVYRILYTLEKNGYLTRNPSDHRFRLTREVRLLGDNFSDALWVAEIGAPEVGALFREVGWPTNLATFDEQKMLVRESTHRYCSFMTHRTMVGARIHMATSLGQAFAAHASGTAKTALLKLFAHDAEINIKEARERLTAIKKQGYAIAREALEENITAIAAPVHHQGKVVAAVNIVVPANLVPIFSLESSMKVALLSACKRLETGLASINSTDIR